jgi:putative ABC transport system permease protein
VIGVVGDVKQYGLDAPTTMQVYEPATQHAYFSAMTLVVRSAAAPDTLTASVRRVVHDLDPNLPIATARTMRSLVQSSVGPQRFTTTILGTFAGVALLLAVIGVYGLVSFTVGQRTQEIGIRVALGAAPRRVLGLVFREGLALAIGGVTAGTIAALWAARLLQSQLFQASPTDGLVAFSLAPAALVAAVLVACYVPARRALRVDPVTALRQA